MELGVSFAKLEMDGGNRFVPLRRMLGISAFGSFIAGTFGLENDLVILEIQNMDFIVNHDLLDGQTRVLGGNFARLFRV